MFVAAGILVSRLAGLARSRFFAHYFGLSDEGDAFAASFKIPNFLQSLFGEGALSASLIPVYAGLLGREDSQEADRVAGAVASILALIVSTLVLLGVLATPLFIDAVAPGFSGAKRELTIQIVRILFPGAGLLVLSAWCLGVLNSHHRFLLSYAAPVMWNAAMIATMIVYGSSTLPRLAVFLAWGSVAGSALQLVVQLPVVLRVAPNLKFAIDTASEHVRTVIRNFVPVFISRGVVQVSAYIDMLIASYLPSGAVTALSNTQLLYTLPVSLFGISVSAAELPAMAKTLGVDPSSAEAVRRRLNAGLRQIAFFVIPSAVAFLALGDVVASALFQTETGRFTHADAVYVWAILAGSSVGLLASTLGRLYSSTYYALRDTRTPLRYAVVRVVLTTVFGYLFAIPLPRWLGFPVDAVTGTSLWGAAGLTASAGIAGWVEMLMLRRTLNSRIGQTGLRFDYVLKLWSSAIAGAAIGWGVKLILPAMHPALSAALVLGPFGLVFIGGTFALRVPEASTALSRFQRRL
jgi:putative peptidoglycan lipid II flippase